MRVPFILMLAAAASLASVRSSGAPPSLGLDTRTFAVGKGPASVEIADVNHDGEPDLVVANMDDQSVSVLLGDGKRNFTPAPGSPFACGKEPNDIAVADMNGDGNLDLVIANTSTPYITILLGDGRGGFRPAPHSPFATESHPHVHGVAVADFTGDGKPDVATDSWAHDEILMIPGDGAGNLLLPGTAFHTGRRPYQRLRTADFNKDGKPDIVTTDLGGAAVTILLGDGKGRFHEPSGSPFPAGIYPWGVAIDDLNHDGNLDLAIIPYDQEIQDPRQLGVTVLQGDGKGGFATMPGSPFSLAGCKGPDRIATGDINGDGLRDIVVSCAQNDKLFFFLGSKDGSDRTVTHDLSTGWSGLAVADLDADGKDDIVVSNNSFGTVTILFSK